MVKSLGTFLQLTGLWSESVSPLRPFRSLFETTYNTEYDVKSGSVAAKNIAGLVYIDKDIPRNDPKLKTLKGEPADIWKYLGVHELEEKKAMAKGVPYVKAHYDFATPAEKEAVIADCGPKGWTMYSEIIDGYLDKVEHKKISKPPPDPHVDPVLAVDNASKSVKS